MEDYYKILGVNSSATADELRRAYRILARRYHPDVNPGKASEERFKAISQAYATLNDAELRKSYDAEYELLKRRNADSRVEAYRKQQEDHFRARSRFYAGQGQTRSSVNANAKPKEAAKPNFDFGRAVRRATEAAKKMGKSFVGKPKADAESQSSTPTVSRISILEVSISMRDAIFGVRKTIEIAEPEGARKVSVKIPAGVRSGSVVRLRGKASPAEELVIIVRVASHPYLSIHPRGLVAEIPVTVQEAIAGASISVPGIDEALVIKIGPGSQSGTEIRVKEKGIADRDGKRGDIFYKLLIRVPESPDAVGLKDLSTAIEKYYGAQVRRNLPNRLLELEK